MADVHSNSHCRGCRCLRLAAGGAPCYILRKLLERIGVRLTLNVQGLWLASVTLRVQAAMGQLAYLPVLFVVVVCLPTETQTKAGLPL